MHFKIAFKVIERKAKTEIHEFEFYKVFKSLFLKEGETKVNQDRLIKEDPDYEPPKDQVRIIDQSNVAEIFEDIEDVKQDLIAEKLDYEKE